MIFKKSFLKKCKKVFNQHNLILYKGLYPVCYEDNKERRGMITRQQFFVADILLEKKIPFILEYKIKAECFGNFYCDLLIKGKNHILAYEIDGKQHYLNKKQIIRDLKKELYLIEYYGIPTVRIQNEIIDNYDKNPKELMKKLNFLKVKLYNNKNKYLFIDGEKGELKKEIFNVKNKN